MMATDGCAYETCPPGQPAQSGVAVLWFIAPVISLVTLGMTAFIAKRAAA